MVWSPQRTDKREESRAGGRQPGYLAILSGLFFMHAMPIVDTHQHLWDLQRFDLAWLEGDYAALRRDFTLDDYEEDCAGLGVVATVYMEVGVASFDQEAEVAYITELCRSPHNKVAGAVVSGRPGSAGFGEYARRLAQTPEIKGVREVLLDRSPDQFLAAEYLQDIDRLGDLGLRFDIEIEASRLCEAAKLVRHCAATRFILDHCANPDIESGNLSSWQRDVAAIAGHDNVVVKISGLLSRAGRAGFGPRDLAPVIDHLLDSFGAARVMFGSDWPLCTLAGPHRDWVSAVKAVVSGRSDEDQRRLFHDNAVRFYALS